MLWSSLWVLEVAGSLAQLPAQGGIGKKRLGRPAAGGHLLFQAGHGSRQRVRSVRKIPSGTSQLAGKLIESVG